jgi:hypothetical protein
MNCPALGNPTEASEPGWVLALDQMKTGVQGRRSRYVRATWTFFALRPVAQEHLS